MNYLETDSNTINHLTSNVDCLSFEQLKMKGFVFVVYGGFGRFIDIKSINEEYQLLQDTMGNWYSYENHEFYGINDSFITHFGVMILYNGLNINEFKEWTGGRDK
jgi:hypothetical protein